MDKNWASTRRLLGLFVIELMIFHMGCSLINPHITWDDPPCYKESNGTESAPEKKYALECSIHYADNAKQAYKNALGNQSKLVSLLGIGLIPLSAATLGMGILDKGYQDIAWMGLGAAAGYGMGSWLYSKPQQKAFLVGYNATCCAIDAVVPLHYLTKQKNGLTHDLDLLYTSIEAAKTQIGNAKELLKDIPTAERKKRVNVKLIEQANQYIEVAESLVNNANEITAKGKSLDVQLGMAGLSLKQAVDRINGQVSSIIVETGQDLQALSSVIGGLAGVYGQYVMIPAEIKPAAAAADENTKALLQRKPDELSNLKQAINELNKEVQQLGVATHKMADLLNAVASSKPLETLKSCGVSADQIIVPLSIDPSGPIDFKEKASSSEGRIIKGGSAPYAVAFQGNEVEGLSAKQTEPFGPAFVVRITEKTPVGTYTLYISDRSGNRQFVTVRVKTP